MSDWWGHARINGQPAQASLVSRSCISQDAEVGVMTVRKGVQNLTLPHRGLLFVLGFWEIISKVSECHVWVFLFAWGCWVMSERLTTWCRVDALGHVVSAQCPEGPSSAMWAGSCIYRMEPQYKLWAQGLGELLWLAILCARCHTWILGK